MKDGYVCFVQVRTHIVEVLTELPVNDFETVSSAISVLNEATEVKGEISEKAQVSCSGLTHVF